MLNERSKIHYIFNHKLLKAYEIQLSIISFFFIAFTYFHRTAESFSNSFRENLRGINFEC